MGDEVGPFSNTSAKIQNTRQHSFHLTKQVTLLDSPLD